MDDDDCVERRVHGRAFFVLLARASPSSVNSIATSPIQQHGGGCAGHTSSPGCTQVLHAPTAHQFSTRKHPARPMGRRLLYIILINPHFQSRSVAGDPGDRPSSARRVVAETAAARDLETASAGACSVLGARPVSEADSSAARPDESALLSLSAGGCCVLNSRSR
ncbi:hypothetical protein BDV96DRAFT_351549 [Lophiotrema nucula]|uniref:Uncharacterized protein n=1 Tax=Lophiotrema nucula TaxID=690887 RepID=A0A6A5ZKB5_9PLEO|nr:hypothetical protein BDV96DRAFT_351549 [Lophiotrema nucula]